MASGQTRGSTIGEITGVALPEIFQKEHAADGRPCSCIGCISEEFKRPGRERLVAEQRVFLCAEGKEKACPNIFVSDGAPWVRGDEFQRNTP